MKARLRSNAKRRCSSAIAVSQEEVNTHMPVLSRLFVTVLVLVVTACGQPARPTPAPVATEAPTPTEAPVAAATEVSTPTPEQNPPHRVLFIGSLTADTIASSMEKIVAASDDAARDMEIQASAAWYASLEQHWNGTTQQETNTLALIDEGPWDSVVLQERAARAFEESSFREYARKLDERIRAVGARTVLFMHWSFGGRGPLVEDEMARIARIVTDLGTEIDAPVAPVDLAWQRSFVARPDLNLYGDGDSGGPSEAGRYLTVCVLYATIFDESPAGLTVEPWEFGILLSEEDAAFLQRIAAETVEEYQAGL